MFYITKINEPVPTWLEKIKVHKGGQRGYMNFDNICVVWQWNGMFYMLGLLNRPAIKIRKSYNVTVKGQGKGVHYFGNIIFLVKRCFSH